MNHSSPVTSLASICGRALYLLRSLRAYAAPRHACARLVSRATALRAAGVAACCILSRSTAHSALLFSLYFLPRLVSSFRQRTKEKGGDKDGHDMGRKYYLLRREAGKQGRDVKDMVSACHATCTYNYCQQAPQTPTSLNRHAISVPFSHIWRLSCTRLPLLLRGRHATTLHRCLPLLPQYRKWAAVRRALCRKSMATKRAAAASTRACDLCHFSFCKQQYIVTGRDRKGVTSHTFLLLK